MVKHIARLAAVLLFTFGAVAVASASASAEENAESSVVGTDAASWG